MQPDQTPPVSPAESHESQHRSGRQKLVSGISFFINWIAVPALIFFILHNFVFQPFHVVGHSMVPTLNESDYLIVSKLDKTWSGVRGQVYIPRRGQMAVFHYPKDPDLVFVKRVIGVPGDRVVIKDGSVRVYTQENPQGYDPDDDGFATLGSNTQGNYDEVIPEGSIFVLGDNRTPNGSFDSREWGPLPSSYIVGVAKIRLLPVTKIKTYARLPLTF